MICIIGFALGGESIGPGAEFEIETISGSLVGIVCSAPVADYSPVETPLSFQDIVQEVLVMTEVLTFI